MGAVISRWGGGGKVISNFKDKNKKERKMLTTSRLPSTTTSGMVVALVTVLQNVARFHRLFSTKVYVEKNLYRNESEFRRKDKVIEKEIGVIINQGKMK